MQRWQNDSNFLQTSTRKFSIDSGIENDWNSTRTVTPIEEQQQQQSQRFIRFPFDGISQRIRPATMKNSENGDFIICRTDRGDFIAVRNPIVPQWVEKLVNQIESEQRDNFRFQF